MSNGGININMSGGNANFGNVSQGNKNTTTVQSQTINQEANQAFNEFFERLNALSASNQAGEQQVAELRNEVAALQATVAAEDTPAESLGQIAKSLGEKYGWAADILKGLWAVIL